MRYLFPLLLTACTQGDFATQVVSFEPGENAGFGQDQMPDIPLGPPMGAGEGAGSLDVVSLGRDGVIILDLGEGVQDRSGPDLIVFENPFPGWLEYGIVGVSEDGITFTDWPCADDGAGCAGVTPVLSHPDNDIDPHNPDTAGGDAFDLADIGLSYARYVRITDSGTNSYAGISGGFDLDAISIVHP